MPEPIFPVGAPHRTRTPLAAATLLHVCVDYGETEIALWLPGRGKRR